MPQKMKEPERRLKRPYLKQVDVPGATLNEALRIPKAIHEHFAGQATSPLLVAKALQLDPQGSQLKVLSGAAIAFGLIEGGAQASAISMTDLAERIIRAPEEKIFLMAMREAILKPRVFGEFLSRYDGKSLPREDLGQNVLEMMGVPREKTKEVLTRIVESADYIGIIMEIKGKRYISLDQHSRTNTCEDFENKNQDESDLENASHFSENVNLPKSRINLNSKDIIPPDVDNNIRRRVFITHGKNQEFVQPLKKILEFGELYPIISVEKQSVSKPVPEKVMDDMRSCGAAIIHVDAETKMIDQDGIEHAVLNPNVLIEIGAAMAFYGRRFILLCREGVKLPSNLQGLYEVRYSGDTLGGDVTIKLLEAIKDIKNYDLPKDRIPG